MEEVFLDDTSEGIGDVVDFVKNGPACGDLLGLVVFGGGGGKGRSFTRAAERQRVIESL